MIFLIPRFFVHEIKHKMVLHHYMRYNLGVSLKWAKFLSFMMVRTEKKAKSINFLDANVDMIAQKAKLFNDFDT